MVLLGVVIGKCEMSCTHISQENEHAILVVKRQFMSYNFSGIKLHFFLNLFDRNIIKSYLNIYLLFCVQ